LGEREGTSRPIRCQPELAARGRIRDVVAAREVIIELFDALSRGLTDRGADLADPFASPERTRRAWDALASFDVAVTLKTSYHRDPMRRWSVNDITDIDALGSTVPCCDMVLTGKGHSDPLESHGLAERLDTIVTSRLSEVADYVS
jgi:hypothetical protein